MHFPQGMIGNNTLRLFTLPASSEFQVSFVAPRSMADPNFLMTRGYIMTATNGNNCSLHDNVMHWLMVSLTLFQLVKNYIAQATEDVVNKLSANQKRDVVNKLMDSRSLSAITKKNLLEAKNDAHTAIFLRHAHFYIRVHGGKIVQKPTNHMTNAKGQKITLTNVPFVIQSSSKLIHHFFSYGHDELSRMGFSLEHCLPQILSESTCGSSPLISKGPSPSLKNSAIVRPEARAGGILVVKHVTSLMDKAAWLKPSGNMDDDSDAESE